MDEELALLVRYQSLLPSYADNMGYCLFRLASRTRLVLNFMSTRLLVCESWASVYAARDVFEQLLWLSQL